MATFSEHDRVMLRTCYPEVPVQRMAKGTIIEAYGSPPSAYEVEFPGVEGAYTLPADALVLIRE